MKKILIVADCNDGDYAKDVVSVEDEVFEKFRPLMDAINNFEPYVAKCEFCHIVNHNWESCRLDLGEKNLYDTYPQFSKDYIDEFVEVFMSGLWSPFGDGRFHTIVTIQDVVNDECYVQWEQDYRSVQKKYNSKVWGYINEYNRLNGYKRKSGLGISSIPFSEMTPEESAIIEEMHNLWRKYQ